METDDAEGWATWHPSATVIGAPDKPPRRRAHRPGSCPATWPGWPTSLMPPWLPPGLACGRSSSAATSAPAWPASDEARLLGRSSPRSGPAGRAAHRIFLIEGAGAEARRAGPADSIPACGQAPQTTPALGARSALTLTPLMRIDEGCAE